MGDHEIAKSLIAGTAVMTDPNAEAMGATDTTTDKASVSSYASEG